MPSGWIESPAPVISDVPSMECAHSHLDLTMKTIPAGEFKTHCLRIMDEVNKRRRSIVITKKGIAVAKPVPVEEISRDVIGSLAGEIEILGDIEAPSRTPRPGP